MQSTAQNIPNLIRCDLIPDILLHTMHEYVTSTVLITNFPIEVIKNVHFNRLCKYVMDLHISVGKK